MKKFLLALSFFFLLSSFPLHAKENKKPPPSLHTVHTYGGGAMLEATFNAVKMLIYGKSETGLSKTFGGIVRIAIIIGAFVSILVAFSKGDFSAVVKNWFLPSLAICGVLLIPTTTLFIHDHLIAKSGNTHLRVVSKVDNVPFFLVIVASLTSYISYKITESIEEVAHGDNSKIYDWTGHIYAGETLFKAGHVQISDPNLEENLKKFCYHCIYNDLNINPPAYTRQELHNAKDLLDFLDKKTNPWLSFPYRDDTGESKLTRCHIGIRKIKTILEGANIKKPFSILLNQDKKNQERATTAAIFGNLQSDSHLLISQSNEALENQRKFLQQQYLIDTVKSSTNPKYSTFRAEQLHRTNQNILGTLAHSTIGMRNLFEGLIYFSFPLVIIFALASFGFKALITWLQFLLWIMMWPPFFVIMNFFVHFLWKMRLLFKFGNLTAPSTIFTSHGLSDIYASMEGAASIALFFVPWIAFAILKGGVQSMVHLAGSLNAPAQSASSTASHEQVSGNYNFGNISSGGRSFSKYSGVNWDSTSTLAQDKTNYTKGTFSQSTDAAGNTTMHQVSSNTRANPSLANVMGSGYEQNVSNAQNAVDTTSTAFNKQIGNTSAASSSFHQALGKDGSFSHIENAVEQKGAQTLLQETQAKTKDLSEILGVSKNEAAEVSFGLGIGKVGGRLQKSVSSLDQGQYREAQNLSQQISTNYQTLAQHSLTNSQSDNLSESQKAAQDYTQSVSKTESLSDQHSVAVSKLETAQESQRNWETNQGSIQQNLNTEFTDHLFEKNNNDRGLVENILSDPKKSMEEAKDFRDHYFQQQALPTKDFGTPSLTVPESMQGAQDQMQEVPTIIDEGRSNLSTRMDSRKEEGIPTVEKEEFKKHIETSIPETDYAEKKEEYKEKNAIGLAKKAGTKIGESIVKGLNSEVVANTTQRMSNFAKQNMMLTDPTEYIRVFGPDAMWMKANPNWKK